MVRELADEPVGSPEKAAAHPSPARRLAADVLVYGSGRFALQLFPFLALPVLSRILTVDDYGAVTTITALVALVTLVANLGLDSASQRSWFDYTDGQADERRTMLSTAFWTTVAASVAVAGALAAASGPVADLLFEHDGLAGALALAVAAIPVTLLSNFFQEIMRLLHQPWRYSLVSAVAGASTAAFTLWFVAGPRWGVAGFFAGLLVGMAGPFILGFALTRHLIRLRFDPREFRVMMAYGLPLVLVGGFAWVIQLVDRFFLLRFSSLEETGLYGVGAQLPGVLLLAVTAVAIAWSPFILGLDARDPERARFVRAKTLTAATIAFSYTGVAITVLSPEFFRIVTGPGFEDAYRVVGMLTAGNVAIGLAGIVGTGLTLKRKTRYFARYAFYSAAVNVALNFALIPPLGKEGAAMATLASYAAMAGLYLWRERIVDPVPYELARVGAILGVSAAIGATGSLVVLDPLWLSVLVKAALLGGLALAAYAGGVAREFVLSAIRSPDPAHSPE